MIRIISKGFLLTAILLLTVMPAAAADGDMQIFFIDVEGGAATLIVSPAGESLLIDCGWPGNDYRDALRIVDAAKKAGVERIDHFVASHFHTDHFGGIAQLADLIPVDRLYDRGPVDGALDNPKNEPYLKDFMRLSKGNPVHLRPGDTIPLSPGDPSLEVLVLAANLQVISRLDAEPNLNCSLFTPREEKINDNARSVVLQISFGDFQFFVGGDLTWNMEAKLVCPNILVEDVDMLQVNHHGLGSSSNPILYHALSPEVAILCNGKTKGPAVETAGALRRVKSINAIYQLNRNITIPAKMNTSQELTANWDDSVSGNGIHVSVGANLYRITVGNNGRGTTYPIQ